MNYLSYLTREGDTWDQIAWRYYGDAMRYPSIVAANPHVPITAALPAGIKLSIPMLEPAPSAEELPPWMR